MFKKEIIKEYIKWILKQIFLYIRQFNYQKNFLKYHKSLKVCTNFPIYFTVNYNKYCKDIKGYNRCNRL